MRPRVAVLRGGPSDEYDVSMQTGRSILAALADSEYEPIDVIITKRGEWLVNGFPRQPRDVLSIIDAAFIGLHGTYGEDGTVQRLLDRHGVPYTGSRAYASSLAMNKILTKEHLYDTTIQMPLHMRVTGGRNTDIDRLAHTLEDLLGTDFVVKPVAGGSSIGTRVGSGAAALARTLREVLAERDEVLVEQRIRGREATCGVIERFREQDIYVLPTVEIVPPADAGFFAAEVKYTGETEEICPARFTNAEKDALAAAARLVHETLGLSQYSRSDFIVTDTGDVYFLEVNTLPGLTEQSLMPKALGAVGSSHGEFVRHVLHDAMTRRTPRRVNHIR